MKNSALNRMKPAFSAANYSYGVALTILLFIGFLTYQSLRDFEDASGWRIHTYDVLVSINELLLNIVNAESAQRGYLITGEKKFLQTYSESLATIHHRQADLQTLTQDNRPQQERLIRLRALIERKLNGLNQRIKLRESKGLDAVAFAIVTGIDRPVMDNIRSIGNDMIREEQNLLKIRETYSARRFTNTKVILIFGSLASLGLLRIAFGMLRREIAVRREAEDRVQGLNAKLEENVLHLQALNKDLDAFNYSVTHDLRTPLRAVDGYSRELLLNLGDRLDQNSRSDLSRIRAAATRMGQLIDDLLNLSRLTRAEMEIGDVNLSTLATDIIRECRRTNPQRQVEISVPSDIHVQGDPKLLRIVLENLISNAWKFTEMRPQAKIEMGVLDQNGKRVVYVKDNGAGFDMAYVGKLFGPFQRLHNADEFPGTGIGLSTAHRIIQRHGGTIWAEGKVNEGAAIYFSLP
jgi:signal transduction histidine kinase